MKFVKSDMFNGIELVEDEQCDGCDYWYSSYKELEEKHRRIRSYISTFDLLAFIGIFTIGFTLGLTN